MSFPNIFYNNSIFFRLFNEPRQIPIRFLLSKTHPIPSNLWFAVLTAKNLLAHQTKLTHAFGQYSCKKSFERPLTIQKPESLLRIPATARLPLWPWLWLLRGERLPRWPRTPARSEIRARRQWHSPSRPRSWAEVWPRRWPGPSARSSHALECTFCGCVQKARKRICHPS